MNYRNEKKNKKMVHSKFDKFEGHGARVYEMELTWNFKQDTFGNVHPNSKI